MFHYVAWLPSQFGLWELDNGTPKDKVNPTKVSDQMKHPVDRKYIITHFIIDQSLHLLCIIFISQYILTSSFTGLAVPGQDEQAEEVRVQGRDLVTRRPLRMRNGVGFVVIELQSGAAGCVKGFETCFLEVPLACLGSMAAAVQPSCPWNPQKTCYITFSMTCCPTL